MSDETVLLDYVQCGFNLFTTHHINLYSRGKRVGLSSSFVLYQKKNEIGYVSCFIFFLNGSVMLDL